MSVSVWGLECKLCFGPHFIAELRDGKLYLRCAFCSAASWDSVETLQAQAPAQ
jgi:hypothetical protein